MKKNILLCLCGLIGTVILSGCGNGAKDDTLLVAMEATFPPFEMTNDKGEIIGLDVDLLRAIGAVEGLTFEFQDLSFDSLIPALQSGQIDIAASGMSITPERQKEILFSDPYIEAGLAIAVPANNTTIKTSADLKGKVIAVQQGSTGAAEADKLMEKGVIKSIKSYPSVSIVMMELLNGGADAVINDKPVTEAYAAKQNGTIKLLPETLASDSYGLAVEKSRTELVAKLNNGLKTIRENGEFDKIMAKYFGTED